MSNSLDPDHDGHFVQTVCKYHQQMTKYATSRQRVNIMGLYSVSYVKFSSTFIPLDVKLYS